MVPPKEQRAILGAGIDLQFVEKCFGGDSSHVFSMDEYLQIVRAEEAAIDAPPAHASTATSE